MKHRVRVGLGLLSLGAVLAVGCGSTESTRDTSGAGAGPAAVESAVATPTDPEPDAGPAVATRTRAETEAQVEAAVQYAFGLEATLFADADAVASKAEVAAHFRQGFATSLADDLAAYLWDRDRLRTGAPTLVPPANVVLLAAGGATATAYFETPPALRQTWELARYTRVELERRGSRWLVTATSQRDTRPR